MKKLLLLLGLLLPGLTGWAQQQVILASRGSTNQIHLFSINGTNSVPVYVVGPLDEATGRLLVQTEGITLEAGDVTISDIEAAQKGSWYMWLAVTNDDGSFTVRPQASTNLVLWNTTNSAYTISNPLWTTNGGVQSVSGGVTNVNIEKVGGQPATLEPLDSATDSVLALLSSEGVGGSAANPIWTTNNLSLSIGLPATATNTAGKLFAVVTDTNGVVADFTNTNNANVCVTNPISVGCYTGVCTNSVAISASQHTVGMVITSGILTNFFAINGGSAELKTFTWTQFSQTNTDNKIVWFFSRPITAVVNNSLWVPTEADMTYLCSSPIKLGCDTNSVIPFGTAGFAQYAANLGRPMCNTYTNRHLYFVVTQDTVASAANTANTATTARVRVTCLQDVIAKQPNN